MLNSCFRLVGVFCVTTTNISSQILQNAKITARVVSFWKVWPGESWNLGFWGLFVLDLLKRFPFPQTFLALSHFARTLPIIQRHRKVLPSEAEAPMLRPRGNAWCCRSRTGRSFWAGTRRTPRRRAATAWWVPGGAGGRYTSSTVAHSRENRANTRCSSALYLRLPAFCRITLRSKDGDRDKDA